MEQTVIGGSSGGGVIFEHNKKLGGIITETETTNQAVIQDASNIQTVADIASITNTLVNDVTQMYLTAVIPASILLVGETENTLESLEEMLERHGY